MNKPFVLKAEGKDYLWGGSRLKEDFHKEIDLEPLAESWECSVHPAGPSMVGSGEHRGRRLTEVLEENPEYIGSHPDKKTGFPILVKLIDAKENLSVQVHPDDVYAAEHENGSLGKTELWYVLEAEDDTELTYGFVRDMDVETLQQAIAEDSVEKYLNRIKIHKNDVFYVEPGTVHGIGAGAVIAEIQQNSNITYRLYDYHRLDKNGEPRDLHLKQAMEVANLQGGHSPRQPMRVLQYRKGCASELLCRCKYFQVERLLLNTLGLPTEVDYGTDETSFEVLLCVEGSGCLAQKRADTDPCTEDIFFRKGDCIFVPAQSVPLSLTGNAQLLKIHC